MQQRVNVFYKSLRSSFKFDNIGTKKMIKISCGEVEFKREKLFRPELFGDCWMSHFRLIEGRGDAVM